MWRHDRKASAFPLMLLVLREMLQWQGAAAVLEGEEGFAAVKVASSSHALQASNVRTLQIAALHSIQF